MADTGDKTYAATKAGYAHPAVKAHAVMQRPAVQAEIAKLQLARLFEEALPLAVNTICQILQDPKAPAGARVQASKVVFDRTLGMDGAGKTKDPHEMTPDELAKAIDELKRIASDRARPVQVLEHEAEDEPKPDLFG